MKPEPLSPQVNEGDLKSTPFAQLLIELFDSRQTGTLLIYAADESLHAAVLIEAGRPRAVLAAESGVQRVTGVLIPLCGLCEGRFEFCRGQDLVGSDGVAAAAPIDPLAMLTVAMREAPREDMLAQAMGLISRSLIKLHAGLDLKRYGLNAEERLVVRALEQGPLELSELRAQAQVDPAVLERVLYLLRLTRGIVLLPLRGASGVMTHAAPVARASLPPDLGSSSVTDTARASGAPESRRSPSTGSMPAARLPQAASPAGASSPAPANRRTPSWQSLPAVNPAATPSARPSQVSSASMRMPLDVDSLPPGDGDPFFGSLPSESAPARSLPPSETRSQRDQAEQLWEQAEVLSKRGEHDSALRTARKAVKLSKTEPEREALLGWLMYQHGGAGAEVHPHVWKCLDHALKRDPLCEEALYYKGMVLSRSGNGERAQAYFQRVQMLNPKHVEAEREVRIYEIRKQNEGQSGFLKRFWSGRPSAKGE